MNRGKKKGGDKAPGEVVPDEFRCKRSDGKQWRCTARAMENKTLCQKHYDQAKKRAAGAAGKEPARKKAKIKASGQEITKATGGKRKVSSGKAKGNVPEVNVKTAGPEPQPKVAKSAAPVTSTGKRVGRPKAENGVAKRKKSNNEEHAVNLKGKVKEQDDDSTVGDEDYVNRSTTSGRERRVKEASTKPSVEKEPEKGRRSKDSKMCHQCQRNDKGKVIYCHKCNSKRYCLHCIARWYPELELKDFEEACPVCRGNCNCKTCLRMNGPKSSSLQEAKMQSTDAQRIAALRHILVSISPFLRQLHREQKDEIDLEAKLKGGDPVVIGRSKLNADERLYCDNCSTSIVNLYRGCQNCDYDLCLKCCGELRQGQQPGGEQAGSAEHQSYERVKESGVGSKYSADGNYVLPLPVWKVTDECIIPCPPKERGGCGSSQLSLKRIGKANWISKLIAHLDTALGDELPPGPGVSGPCSLCFNGQDSDMMPADRCLRQAATRSDSASNYIYCPSALDMGKNSLPHFQKHWIQGDPVIVRDVLERTKGLSWEPMVMWRAVRETTKNKFVEETKTVKAIDCLDWCEVEINIHQFFKGYQEGRMHRNGWPETLKLKDWPPVNFFHERLPRHGAEFISALPFHDYTHPTKGIFNLASKLPENVSRPDLGPKTYVAYGFTEELAKGDSVTKLHCDMSDAVNVLTHTSEVKLAPWQLQKIRKYKKRVEGSRPKQSSQSTREVATHVEGRSGEQNSSNVETHEQVEAVEPEQNTGTCLQVETNVEAVKQEAVEDIVGKDVAMSKEDAQQDGDMVLESCDDKHKHGGSRDEEFEHDSPFKVDAVLIDQGNACPPKEEAKLENQVIGDTPAAQVGFPNGGEAQHAAPVEHAEDGVDRLEGSCELSAKEYPNEGNNLATSTDDAKVEVNMFGGSSVVGVGYIPGGEDDDHSNSKQSVRQETPVSESALGAGDLPYEGGYMVHPKIGKEEGDLSQGSGKLEVLDISNREGNDHVVSNESAKHGTDLIEESSVLGAVDKQEISHEANEHEKDVVSKEGFGVINEGEIALKTEEDEKKHTTSGHSKIKALTGGALWDIFRRQDVPKLRAYLRCHWTEFRHIKGKFLDYVVDPIHDQTIFLDEKHKEKLKEEYGVEPWTFEQYSGEAVFIPAGCPHQVRNTKSCIKVALDFVSPENLQQCVLLADEYRLLPKEHRAKEDKLEVKKMTLYAASSAVKELKSLISTRTQPGDTLNQQNQIDETHVGAQLDGTG